MQVRKALFWKGSYSSHLAGRPTSRDYATCKRTLTKSTIDYKADLERLALMTLQLPVQRYTFLSIGPALVC